MHTLTQANNGQTMDRLGFEPRTFCVLGEHLTSRPPRITYLPDAWEVVLFLIDINFHWKSEDPYFLLSSDNHRTGNIPITMGPILTMAYWHKVAHKTAPKKLPVRELNPGPLAPQPNALSMRHRGSYECQLLQTCNLHCGIYRMFLELFGVEKSPQEGPLTLRGQFWTKRTKCF